MICFVWLSVANANHIRYAICATNSVTADITQL
jgi:hypothetical protein